MMSRVQATAHLERRGGFVGFIDNILLAVAKDHCVECLRVASYLRAGGPARAKGDRQKTKKARPTHRKAQEGSRWTGILRRRPVAAAVSASANPLRASKTSACCEGAAATSPI